MPPDSFKISSLYKSFTYLLRRLVHVTHARMCICIPCAHCSISSLIYLLIHCYSLNYSVVFKVWTSLVGTTCGPPAAVSCLYRDTAIYRRSMFGRRAFSVAFPVAWNMLPDYLRDPTRSVDSSRCDLKTFQFSFYYRTQRIRGFANRDYALYKSTTDIDVDISTVILIKVQKYPFKYYSILLLLLYWFRVIQLFQL